MSVKEFTFKIVKNILTYKGIKPDYSEENKQTNKKETICTKYSGEVEVGMRKEEKDEIFGGNSTISCLNNKNNNDKNPPCLKATLKIMAYFTRLVSHCGGNSLCKTKLILTGRSFYCLY